MVSGLLGGTGDSMLTRIMLYQVVGQLLAGALGPYWRALEYQVNQRTPNAKLTPAELAALVERTFLDESIGAGEAAAYGINASRFRQLVQLQETAPPPEWLAVALRRQIIPEAQGSPEDTSFESGIAQGTIAKKWAPVIKAMATNIPTPELALDSLLEGQTEYAEALAYYEQFGGDPQFFELAFNTRGSAPTPVEAGVLANRGIIPWEGRGPGVTSFEQAFFEGPWRNKWLGPMREYAYYRPPPRTVTALLRAGSITDEQAAQAFQDYGMSPEWAAIYVRDGHTERNAGTHTLARTTIERLYVDKVVTRDEAKGFLTDEGYSDQDAEYLLTVVDLAGYHASISAVIGRIRTLYGSYKIERAEAAESLTRLGITGERQTDLIELWDIQRDASARQLTPAQIVAAMKADLFTGAEALQQLQQQGYAPHDGWVLLRLGSAEKAPPEPPRDAI